MSTNRVRCLIGCFLLTPMLAMSQSWRAHVVPHWDNIEGTLNTTPTYQIVGSGMMLPVSPIHDRVFQNLHDLGGRLCTPAGLEPFSANRGRGIGAAVEWKGSLGFLRDGSRRG